MTPGRKHSVKLLGSTLTYWAYGPLKGAPVIVAIHGFRGTHHGLEKIVDQAPEYTWIMPDLPGFGESTPFTDTPHDIDGYAALFDAFIPLVTRPEEDVILLGHSFGSIIAAKIATDPPKNVHKLILINPIAKNPNFIGRLGSSIYFAAGAALGEERARRYFANTHTVNALSFLMTKTRHRPTRAYVKDQHLAHFSDYATVTTLHQSFKASISRNVGQFVRDIKLPTLLIAGSRDEIAPVKSQYWLLGKTVAPTELAVVEHVGHLIHYEKPDDAAVFIGTFLDNPQA